MHTHACTQVFNGIKGYFKRNPWNAVTLTCVVLTLVNITLAYVDTVCILLTLDFAMYDLDQTYDASCGNSVQNSMT